MTVSLIWLKLWTTSKTNAMKLLLLLHILIREACKITCDCHFCCWFLHDIVYKYYTIHVIYACTWKLALRSCETPDCPLSPPSIDWESVCMPPHHLLNQLLKYSDLDKISLVYWKYKNEAGSKQKGTETRDMMVLQHSSVEKSYIVLYRVDYCAEPPPGV